MSHDYIGPISNSFPGMRKTHIRFVVRDKVKAQVIDTKKDKVIREVPRQLSSNIFQSIYV